MKIFKYVITGIMLLTILTACIFLPLRVAEYKDGKIYGNTIFETENEITIYKKKELDTISKLALIKEADSYGSKIALYSAADHILPKKITVDTAISEEQVVETSIKELKRLKELGILPPIVMEESPTMSDFELYTYVDTITPVLYVMEWKVFLSYPGFSVNLSLEDGSGKIYGLVLGLSEGESFESVDIDSLPPKWADYLELDYVDTLTDIDSVMGVYTKNDTITWFGFKEDQQLSDLSILSKVPAFSYGG